MLFSALPKRELLNESTSSSIPFATELIGKAKMATSVQPTVLRLEAREDFVQTPAIEQVCLRAMSYLGAGYACHFRGSAGTGKTTLALHLARLRGRPVILMFGDEEFATSDLVGTEKGLFST